MFTVTAKDRDVVITGMNAITRRNIANEITVYTKPGTYRTEGNASPIVAELHAEEWTEIYRGEIPSQEKRLVPLNDFATSVTIGAGQTQSFYAYVKYGLLYTAAAAAVTAEGASGIDEIAAEDAGIIIHEGQVTRGLFQRVVGRGRWGGEMRYRLA